MLSVFRLPTILDPKRFAMFPRRLSSLGTRLLLAFGALALAALCASAPAARAQQVDSRGEVFAVRDVQVDVTAETAAAAREEALATAQRNAYLTLLARLTPASVAGKLPKVDGADLADLVSCYEVQQEKNSPVRYIATLTYHFKPTAIEQLLRQAGVGFAETPSKPVLVLPIMVDGDAKSLWEDPNPWRVAWTNLPPSTGLVPFTAPIGDIEDIGAITSAQAIAGDADKLQAMANRYGAGSTLVTTATLRRDGSGNLVALDLAVARIGQGIDQPVSVLSVAAAAGETSDALFTHAALAVEADVTERWKQDNLLHYDQSQSSLVSVPFARLEDWLTVRGRLDQIAFVSRAELVALTRAGATVDLAYLGDPAQLKLALAQRDLLLTEEGGGLVLRLAPQGAAAK
jgi:hypothetical protein